MALLPRVNKVSLDRDRDRDRDPSSTRHVYRCLTRISGSVSKTMETLNWRSSSPWLLTVPVDHCHKEHPDNSWCRSSAGMFNKFWNEFYIIEFYFGWSCIIDQHLNSAIFFWQKPRKGWRMRETHHPEHPGTVQWSREYDDGLHHSVHRKSHRRHVWCYT